MAVREFALQRGSLFVITGVISSQDKTKWLNNRVAVPSQIYKLVYEPSSGRAAAYLESSQPGEIYSVIDLNELQHITSFNFLPKTKVTGVIDLPAAHVGKSSLSIRNGMKK